MVNRFMSNHKAPIMSDSDLFFLSNEDSLKALDLVVHIAQEGYTPAAADLMKVLTDYVSPDAGRLAVFIRSYIRRNKPLD